MNTAPASDAPAEEPQSPPPPPPTEQPKRLYRSSDDRMLGGVCGGIAAYANLDPTVVRLLAIAAVLLPGPALIAYLVAWVVVPEQPQ